MDSSIRSVFKCSVNQRNTLIFHSINLMLYALLRHDCLEGKLFYFMKYRALSREIFHLVIFITSENKMEFFSLISLEMIHVFVCCLIYSLDYLKLPANSLQFLVIFFPLSNGAAQKLKLRELWSSIFASCWYQLAFIPSTHKKPTLLMHSEITFHRRHLPVKDKNKENY